MADLRAIAGGRGGGLHGAVGRPAAHLTPVRRAAARAPAASAFAAAHDEARENRRDRRRVVLVSLLSALALATWTAWSSNAERRAIAAMPPAQRRILYDHAAGVVRAMCLGHVDAALRPRCREQAESLLDYPECDRDCQRLVTPLLYRPTR